MQRPDSPPSCWTLTDGHAGNVRQAAALAAALGLAARSWTLRPRAPWRMFAPRRMPGDHDAFGPDFLTALDTPPALAIGCGRQAALATRLLRAQGSRTVQILDPRVASAHWDLVIAPEHDALAGPNVITLAGSLHPVDGAWLAQARARCPELQYAAGPQVAVLVGGRSAHARLDVELLDALAEPLRAWAGSRDARIVATASRRTPAAVRDRMREQFAGPPHRAWLDEADGPNPYAGLLGWADFIVCTADSVNMLSEACATDAPVYVHGADAVGGRPRRFVDRLLDRGRVRRFEGLLEPFVSTPLRETARVADEVRRRLQLVG